MGLDVYVGSLVRYYTGNWETIVQQLGRETGMHVEVRRPPQPKPTLIDRIRALFSPQGAEAAVRDIERWRRQLERQIGIPVAWNEDPDGAYSRISRHGTATERSCCEQLTISSRNRAVLRRQKRC